VPQAFWWPGPQVAADIAIRLAASLILGIVVAWIYRKSRNELASSFTVTLVLLSVLIAMVTQVIGDNIARAFSLVGALSIVRFRTVVRDTQDTAYVIFAVAVGMAVGASSLWVAISGMVIVGLAAWFLRTSARAESGGEVGGNAVMTHRVVARVTIGRNPEQAIAPVLQDFVTARRLVGAATARQGAAIEVTYRVALRRGRPVSELVAAINRIDGVQNVEVVLLDEEADAQGLSDD
jgi:uncharacterized membrane protein YhiD involved in acid resistance